MLRRALLATLLLAALVIAFIKFGSAKAPPPRDPAIAVSRPYPDFQNRPHEMLVGDFSIDMSKLKLMTSQPAPVNATIAALCINPPTVHTGGFADNHPLATAGVTILVSMSPQAADAFDRKAPYYPVNSVIIKEKSSIGIGGMIKHAPGYDPAHGDWEYFYLDDPSQVSHGKIASCIGCHSSAASTDYVFGTWAKPLAYP
jgi:hypothetical protein